jgi:hypothetical protein
MGKNAEPIEDCYGFARLRNLVIALESVAVLRSYYVLVPIVVGNGLAEAYVDRIVRSEAGAQPCFYVDDIQTVYFGGGSQDRAAWLRLKSAGDVPAEELDNGGQ